MEIQGSSIIALNKEGKLLLQLRDNKPNILYPNQWGLFGGHIEKGETTEECAIREFKEETGILLDNVELLTTSQDNNKEVYVYKAIIDLEKEEIKAYEGQKGKFFAKEEIPHKNMIPWQSELIKNLF